MRIIKTVFKIFVISVILVAIIIAGIALYMKFYGKSLLENALSNMLGSKVKFESVSLNLDKYTVNFRDFSILSEINFDENILNAEKCTLILNKERFEKEKKIAFEDIVIKKGVLNIERNKEGIFNISYNSPRKIDDRGAIAYAATPADSGGLYNFAQNVRKLTIKDSVINFKDYYVPQGPFTITCDNFNLDFTSGQESGSSSDPIPVKYTLSFRIPNTRYRDGEFLLSAGMDVYKHQVDTKMAVETKYIDLMQFLPYFESYTPFSFNTGLFSSSTNFRMHNNMIDSTTTMVFHKLNLIIDPGMENAKFLETSANRLVPYLMSGKGEIIFDFIIKGPVDNPRIGLGPRLKFAIGLVVIEELGNFIQQLQKLQK